MATEWRVSECIRTNILSAADSLFRKKGFAQTTVDDIARKADCSKSTVYDYFKNKDEIYSYIFLEKGELLRSYVAEALRDFPGFPDGYFAVCEAFLKFYMANPLYFERILDEVQLPKDESDIVLTEIYELGEKIKMNIAGYLNTWLIRQKISLDMYPLQATYILWAGISGIIFLAHTKEAYINQHMKISKEEFMRGGFELLLKSITRTNAANG